MKEQSHARQSARAEQREPIKRALDNQDIVNPGLSKLVSSTIKSQHMLYKKETAFGA